MNRLILTVCLLASLFSGIAVDKPSSTREEAERIAGKLKFLATHEFLYDRRDLRQLPENVVKEYQGLLRPLFDGQYTVEHWVALLKHKDARVRTLALAALFAREDPKLLPHLASLMDDKALTFPNVPQQFGFGFLEPKFEPKMLKEQTVGEMAGSMVGFYLWRVGFDLHERNPTTAEFASYWEARKDRAHCAGCFAVQLARATEGCSPPSEDRTDRIRSIRKKIDRLPRRDRAWALLWLLEEPGHAIMVTKDELVTAAKELGPDRLLGLLRRQADTDDPDWRYPQKQGTWRYRVATQFVLENAGQLLRPKDAQTLLAYEKSERESVSKGNISPNLTAFWAIGAAQLQPDKGKKILYEAFDGYQARYQKQDRAQLVMALWRTGGLAETKFIVDWFYKEEPELGAIGFGRVSFLRALPDLRPPENRKLLAAIVRDTRFDSLDWQSLSQLIEVLNGWTKDPIVSHDALRDARHPFGIGHFTGQWLGKAEREYPKETANLLKTLQSWRLAVRETLPRWEQPPVEKAK